MIDQELNPLEIDEKKLKKYRENQAPKNLPTDRIWWWGGLRWFGLMDKRLTLTDEAKGVESAYLESWLRNAIPMVYRYEAIRRVSILKDGYLLPRANGDEGPLPFEAWPYLSKAMSDRLGRALPHDFNEGRRVLVPLIDQDTDPNVMQFDRRLGIRLDADDESIRRALMTEIQRERVKRGISPPTSVSRKALDERSPSWRPIELLDGAGRGQQVRNSRFAARTQAKQWFQQLNDNHKLFCKVEAKLRNMQMRHSPVMEYVMRELAGDE